jgi:hypothetical protein
LLDLQRAFFDDLGTDDGDSRLVEQALECRSGCRRILAL